MHFHMEKSSSHVFVDGWPLPKEMTHSYKVFKKIAKLVKKLDLGSRKKITLH